MVNLSYKLNKYDVNNQQIAEAINRGMQVE